MTHSGGKPHAVGYKGQRFEVCFFDPESNKRRVLGWTNDPEDAQQMAGWIEEHPDWESPWITDLFAAEQHDGHPAESALYMTPNVEVRGRPHDTEQE